MIFGELLEFIVFYLTVVCVGFRLGNNYSLGAQPEILSCGDILKCVFVQEQLYLEYRDIRFTEKILPKFLIDFS